MEFLPALRELARAYQAFEAYSAWHLRVMGLTHSQFDVIATLGNQPPMTCKELGEKTLITKGTLTGVLDRLEKKGLVFKVTNQEDGRSQLVGLTKPGQKLFEKIFPAHLQHLEIVFQTFKVKELNQIQTSLQSLKEGFAKATP